jgi:glycosyltransferase involved in cell wall biosynthesis
MSEKYILYLRTDIWDEELTAGGSVTHTLGVIKGFNDLGYSVVCASSCLDSVLKNVTLEKLIKLSNPRWLRFLRWKMNCFLSSFFFFFQSKKLIKQYSIACIYQRYSLLNLTGVFLARWYKKKLILEYNCSEVWIAYEWVSEKKLTFLVKPLSWIERYTIRQADYLVVVSEILKTELIDWGVPAEKILVNPNGVDTDQFDSERVKREQMQ